MRQLVLLLALAFLYKGMETLVPVALERERAR